MRKQYTQRVLGDRFGDSRLDTRFNLICKDLEVGFSKTTPELSKVKSKCKAMYRFFDNEAVTPQKMLASHRKELKSSLSCKQTFRFLQLDDTTDFNYTGKRSAKSLNAIDYPSRKGFLLHNSMITNDLGVPLGLLKQTFISRSPESLGKKKERAMLPLEAKESYRWKAHFLSGQSLCEADKTLEGVYIADREADIMELFQSRKCERMHFVIRSRHNRNLANQTQKLHDFLSAKSTSGTYQIQITHPTTKKVRTAEIEIRFCKATIKLSKLISGKKENLATELYAIQAKEINPPDDIEKGIEWIILTSLPVNTFEQALQIIEYYMLRWIIERFHFLLKSGGANLENLQLETFHRLKNAITINSIAVLNVFKLKYRAEKTPNISIYDAGISKTEHLILYNYAHRKLDKKLQFNENAPPTIREFTIVLGKLGGFIPSKRQPIPGLIILTRAIQTFNTMIDAYLTFCQRTD